MNVNLPSKKFHLSRLVAFGIVGIIVALVAIFVFKVKPSLVLNYGLIVAMIMSHFFMHSGHANHDDQHNQTNQVTSSSQLSLVQIENDDFQNRKHGCH